MEKFINKLRVQIFLNFNIKNSKKFFVLVYVLIIYIQVKH